MYVDSNNSGGGLKGLQVGRMRYCDIFNMALVLPPAAMPHAHVVVVTGPLAPHGFALGLPLGSLIVGFALPQVYYSSTKMASSHRQCKCARTRRRCRSVSHCHKGMDRNY